MLKSVINVIENYLYNTFTKENHIVTGNEKVVKLASEDPKPLYNRFLSESSESLRVPFKNLGLTKIEESLLKWN